MDYSTTYRQKDKGWQYIISRKDENGKWRQIKSKQGFKTKGESKQEAEKIKLELIKQEKNGATFDDSCNIITFKKLVNMYIKHISLYKEYNTIESYEYTFKKFEALNDLKVKDLKRAHIQDCIDDLIKQNLKVKTIEAYTARVKLLLRYYQENLNSAYFVPNNIKIPKNKEEIVKKALTKSELNNLLHKLQDSKYYLIVLIASTCGLRSSEILGLTWNDVDFDNAQLNVNKQWKINKKTVKNDFGDLKTKNSNRVVPIPPETLRLLKKYKKTNQIIDINNRIAPYNTSSIKRCLNPMLKKIIGITIHELRHTYATLLIANGVDFKTAAEFLGHDVQQTIKTYSHVTDEMKKKATETISKIFK